MSPSLLAALTLLACALAVPAWLWGPSWWRAWRRARLLRQPFPAAWRPVLRRHVPAVARLPYPLQQQLRHHIQALLAEVPFIGCNGLQVTDAMRVVVAAQAGLLLLNRPEGRFANLRQILLYPGPFVVDRAVNAAGITQEHRRVLAGESWQQGQVILSWPDVLEGAADPADGRNVVVHEFAHQLDQETGAANGAPWLGRRLPAQAWAATMQTEFDALRQRLARGEPGLIDPYAATDPAEFFAVVSELFFEQPQALAAAHPAVHRALVACYRVDPAVW